MGYRYPLYRILLAEELDPKEMEEKERNIHPKTWKPQR